MVVARYSREVIKMVSSRLTCTIRERHRAKEKLIKGKPVAGHKSFVITRKTVLSSAVLNGALFSFCWQVEAEGIDNNQKVTRYQKPHHV